MGMFDNLICRKPLPSEPPAFIKPGHLFQTKSLECCLSTYTITESGLLYCGKLDPLDESGTVGKAEPVAFHGEIEFYTSNIRASGPLGYGTANGEDAESVDYVAKFVDGWCEEIRETDRTKTKAMPVERLNAIYEYQRQKLAEKMPPEPDVEVGDTLFLMHGMIEPDVEKGKEVKVVTVSKFQKMNRTYRDFAVIHGDGHLEVLHDWQLNSVLFADKEAARLYLKLKQEPYPTAG